MGLLQKRTMKDQIYFLIKERILNQEYEIGSKLNIASLSKEFNVSNTPIREALSMLEKDGFVSISPNSGYNVFTLSDKKIRELEEITSVLMIGSYELCLAQGKQQELVALMEKELEAQCGAIACENALDIAKTSINFDETFFKVLGNKTMEQAYRSIMEQMFLVVFYAHTHGNNDTFQKLEEHKRILEAVKEERHEDLSGLIYNHFNRKIHIDLTAEDAPI